MVKKICLQIVCLSFSVVLLFPQSASAVMFELLGTGLPANPMFNSTPLPPNPSLPGLDFSETDLNAQYQTLFGMPSPNKLPKLIWGENQTTMSMVMASDGSIDTFQTFMFLATGDYWRMRVNLTLNPSTAVIFDPNDEITMDGFVQHFGKLSADGIPHAGDDAAGPMISYDMVANAGNKVQAQNQFGFTTFAVVDNFAAVETHPSDQHSDIVLGILGGNVRPDTNAQISFRDEIEGFWTGAVLAHHAVPEPATMLLFGTGIFGAFLRKRLF